MELENITKTGRSVRSRWYDDACGTAFGLDLIGERWSLLIMRELMFGPRRFGELKRDLNGVSANILTQRLATLEEKLIVRRRMLPPPASVQVYELTEWGYEAEPFVQSIGKWAVRHPDHDPTLPISPASIMMSFRTMFDALRSPDETVRLGFRINGEEFRVVLEQRQLSAERGELAGADHDAVVTAPPEAVGALVYGKMPLDQWTGEGMGTLDGDAEALLSFADCFHLPEKVAADPS